MKTSSIPYLLIAPALIILIAVLIYPLSYSFNLSFQSWNLIRPHLGRYYVGLDNYRKILLDPIFWLVLKNTSFFTVVTVGLEFSIGFGIALLLNRKWKYRYMRAIIRSIILIPMMLTPVVVGLLWQMMYNTELGIINYLLEFVGVARRNWLGGALTAMPAVIVVDVWQKVPFVVLLLLAGLQALPQDPFEAAMIDGASRWQMFKYVTVPLLKPVILVVLILRTMWNFITFDAIYILTKGGPGYATELASTYAYKTGFYYYEMGEASAVAYVITVVVMAFSLVYVRLLGKETTV